jgi:hypothetical protein
MNVERNLVFTNKRREIATTRSIRDFKVTEEKYCSSSEVSLLYI